MINFQNALFLYRETSFKISIARAGAGAKEIYLCLLLNEITVNVFKCIFVLIHNEEGTFTRIKPKEYFWIIEKCFM